MDRPTAGLNTPVFSRGARTVLLLVGLVALGAAGLGLRARAAAGGPMMEVLVKVGESAATEIGPAANSGLDVGPGEAEPVLVGSP
jgi:hypothetical protein